MLQPLTQGFACCCKLQRPVVHGTFIWPARQEIGTTHVFGHVELDGWNSRRCRIRKFGKSGDAVITTVELSARRSDATIGRGAPNASGH